MTTRRAGLLGRPMGLGWLLLMGVSGAALDAAPRLYRDRVEAHWFDGDRQFWYRVETGPGQGEYLLVDAEKGVRRPAFDHPALAQALSVAGITNGGPRALRLESFDIETDGALSFRAGGKAWRWVGVAGQSGGSLIARPATREEEQVAQERGRTMADRSRRTGDETSISFVNRTTGEVSLYWLDSEGERRPYGKLAPGERRDQHTFAGHVWLATDADGTRLGAWEAQEEPLAVEIEVGKAGRADTREPETRKTDSQATPVRRGDRRERRLTSPDGKWTVSFRDHNVVLTGAGLPAEKLLTTNGTAEDSYGGEAHWSPDSRSVVVMRTKKGDDRKVYLVESSPKDQLQPRLISYDYLKPGDCVPISRPHLFDVDGGRHLEVSDALFPNPWSISEMRWCRDSSRFTLLYNERGHQLLRLVAVARQTGEARTLLEERSATFVDYSGKYFAEWITQETPRVPLAPEASADTGSAAPGAQEELIWMSERDGWNHLYLYDATTGQLKNQITRGPWVVRGVDRVDKEKRQVWFRAGGIRPGMDPYYVHYCRVNFDGGGLTVLTDGDGTHRGRFSPGGKFSVDTWSRVDHPPVTELRRTADGSLACRLEEADATELLEAGRRFPERFVTKGRDGVTDIYGVINWPKGFERGKRYPVVESIYAGPQGAFVPKAFSVSHAGEALTDAGFIVVQIDGMGTSHRSKAFHDVCWRNLGDAGLPDRVLWIRAAAGKFPEMDLNRVGIFGTSAGGQSALGALLTHGEFYRAAVADCGCHDNRMDKIWWNEQWMGWPVGPHYEAQSNVTLAHRLRGKLLLLVGELDRNVDPASTMQVVNALVKADKDFELLVVPGMGHGVLGNSYCKRRMVDFFARSLTAE